MGTSKNESYDLAEAWVIKQIDDALHGSTVPRGTMFTARELHQCDCVPIDFSDNQGRRWQLLSAEPGRGSFRSPPGTLTATYQCIGNA